MHIFEFNKKDIDKIKERFASLPDDYFEIFGDLGELKFDKLCVFAAKKRKNIFERYSLALYRQYMNPNRMVQESDLLEMEYQVMTGQEMAELEMID